MKLPVDEEHDEKVVGVPEPLKVRTAALLNRKPNHNAEGRCHNPASCTRTCSEVGYKESNDALAGVRRRRISHRELVEVDHMSCDVYEGEEHDRPSSGLVESDVLVEGYKVVQGRPTEERNEAPAHRQENVDDIDVKDEGSGTSDNCHIKVNKTTLTKFQSGLGCIFG